MFIHMIKAASELLLQTWCFRKFQNWNVNLFSNEISFFSSFDVDLRGILRDMLDDFRKHVMLSESSIPINSVMVRHQPVCLLLTFCRQASKCKGWFENVMANMDSIIGGKFLHDKLVVERLETLHVDNQRHSDNLANFFIKSLLSI